MKNSKWMYWLLMIIVGLFFGCEKSATFSADQIQTIESPALPGSQTPNLFTANDGRIYMSWSEKIENGHALRFSILEGDQWSKPKTIAEGDNWFVNWADFPSIAVLDDGVLAAHWPAKSGKGTYAYDVNISFSKDGGDTWSAPMVPHRDGTQTEHGFVSLLPWQQNRLFAAWLDGRKMAGNGGHDGHGSPDKEMTIRFATIDQDGNLYDEQELDSRICDCCQTSAALTPDGAIVVYRDRSEEEIRDISFVRFESGKWTEPQNLHPDNWKIVGCPVNGPAVDSNDNMVAVAWFTAADDIPRVKVSLSSDGGKTFGDPIQIDDGKPVGRVDVIVLPDNSALVSWVENRGEYADIQIRKVDSYGNLEQPITIEQTSSSRSSGFPIMKRNSQEIVIAWTDVGDGKIVRTAKIPLR